MLRHEAIRIIEEANASIASTNAALKRAEEEFNSRATGEPHRDYVLEMSISRARRQAKYAIAMACARKEAVYRHFPDMKPPARKQYREPMTPERAARKKANHEANLAARREADRQRTIASKSNRK